jgi:hypothetical protein
MLGSGHVRGFSKTAQMTRDPGCAERPHGHHLHAMGRDHGVVAEAVLGGRDANDVAERATERAQAAEADVHAYLSDATLGLTQQKHGTLDSPSLKVSVRRLAEDGTERANEMRFRHVCDGGYRRNVQRLGVGPIHGVARSQHAPVDVLDFTAHGVNATT